MRRETERLVKGAKTSAPPSTLLQGLASGYVNWLGELAATAPSVAEKAAMEFAQAPDGNSEPYVGNEGAGPPTEGDYFEVAGKPFAMPARVLDASQGWAMSFVSTKAANRALGAASDYLSAFDAGDGRTPLTIIGVDYRNSDFGVYPEIAIALTVTAKGDSAGQLFVYYLAIVVTQDFTREAAGSYGGWRKSSRRSSWPPMRRTPCASVCPTAAAKRCRSGFRASVTHTLPIFLRSPSRSAVRLGLRDRKPFGR